MRIGSYWRLMDVMKIVDFTLKLTAVVCFKLGAAGCVSFPDAPVGTAPPVMAGNVVQSLDGALLGLQRWKAAETKAVIIAVHGMNDYARGFEFAGEWWAAHAGITTYAYDQRGFGRSPAFGYWLGAETMAADLRSVVAAARAAHPDLPVFVLGHSMGAAVVMTAAADAKLDADGLILAAPGVWGGGALPVPYRATLNIAASLAPGKTLTGERAQRRATNNIEVLREMFRDPLVIKETRLDAVLGVVRLMGAAYENAESVNGDVLYLIGDKDEIIPKKAMIRAAGRLQGDVTVRIYPEGWHLLFRDRQRETVMRDVARWIDDRLARQSEAGSAAGG
ncbi:MAG: alpha/beta fold hydrolase [Hyphococcus sp.]